MALPNLSTASRRVRPLRLKELPAFYRNAKLVSQSHGYVVFRQEATGSHYKRFYLVLGVDDKYGRVSTVTLMQADTLTELRRLARFVERVG